MIEDEHLAIDEIGTERVYEGFRAVDVIRYRERGRDEGRVVRREIMSAPAAVAVIAWDPEREVLVLVRQFRVAAERALGRGMEVEVVAGLVEGKGEEETVRAELEEEAGVTATRTVRLLDTLSSPGMSDERVAYWYAEVDSAAMAEQAGLDEETEETFPFTCTLDEALAAIDANRVSNAIVILAVLLFARRFEALTGRPRP